MTNTQITTESLSTYSSWQLSGLLWEVGEELLSRTTGWAPSVRERTAWAPSVPDRTAWAPSVPDRTAWAPSVRERQVEPRPHAPARPEDQERLRSMRLYGIREQAPGPRWQALFDATWTSYRAWYASEGLARRPDLARCRAALRRHMPELVPTWESLVRLAGDDEVAARMLSLWNPPAFAPGCAQLVLDRPARVLIRNYDYSPDLFEQVVYSSRFTRRRVIGTGDCLWGLLDGMNDDGLVVSFTYGGRPGSGEGFAISLVVRYLLEVCATVQEARAVLERLPVSMAYNLTISDRVGQTVTAFVAPGSPVEFFDTPLATNHRGLVPEHPQLARRLNSVGRQGALRHLLQSGPDSRHATEAFLRKPLHNTAYSQGFGTLYTAVYHPEDGVVEYHWPTTSWRRSFSSPDGTKEVVLREPATT